MAETTGMKEFIELLDAVELLAQSAVNMSKNFETSTVIAELVNLGMKFETIKNGFANMNQIPSEFKNFSEEDAQMILARIFALVKIIKAAFEKEQAAA